MAVNLTDAAVATRRHPPRPAAVTVPAAVHARSAVRPEIQAMRATAVLLVVVYHLWPAAMPGGFVGVDVFFAISGFLITAQLLKEVDRTGTVSLAGFWARRARRILPAALLLLLLCGVATLLVVPQEHWRQFLGEIGASATYRQNWQLASSSVDYLQSANGASPVEHFWSLSAEEQFYLVWPLLIVGAIYLVRRRPPQVRRRMIGWTFAGLTLASFAYSVYETRANPGVAYFITPTRAWEFGLGGLLALARAPDGSRARGNSLLSWAGIAAIMVAALTFSGATPFPSYAALLPVLGTLAVMHAGAPQSRWAPTPMLRLAPVQYLGDVSYSVYLWHWPLLILAPFALHGTYAGTEIAVLALALVAAGLTKRLVEDPVRDHPFLKHRPPHWTFGFAAVATAVVFLVPLGGGSVLTGRLQHDRAASAKILASHPACFGAAARDPWHQPCDNQHLRLAVVPTPLEAENAANAPCTDVELTGLVSVCEFGVVDGSAARTIALVGDSHGSHWRAAVNVVARERGWRGLSITRTGCAFSAATKHLAEPARSQCRSWNRQVPQWFARHPDVHTIFVSAITGGRVDTARGQSVFEAEVSGFRRAWATLPASVRHIVVLRDPPKVRAATAGCVQGAREAHRPAGPACALPRSTALRPDPQVAAAKRIAGGRAATADLTPFFCTRTACLPVIGGALAYKDIHHLTAVFARTLGPFLLRRVAQLEAAWGTDG